MGKNCHAVRAFDDKASYKDPSNEGRAYYDDLPEQAPSRVAKKHSQDYAIEPHEMPLAPTELN